MAQAQEVPMALINIKDLPQSDELDRRAMLAIIGGTRAGVGPAASVGTTFRSGRVIDYPPGFSRDTSDEVNPQRLVT